MTCCYAVATEYVCINIQPCRFPTCTIKLFTLIESQTPFSRRQHAEKLNNLLVTSYYPCAQLHFTFFHLCTVCHCQFCSFVHCATLSRFTPPKRKPTLSMTQFLHFRLTSNAQLCAMHSLTTCTTTHTYLV